MMRPLLLDLYCGGGGAGMGFFRAGFDVVGVDIEPQPRYPFRFIRADALEYLAEHWREYDVFHASPPCQRFTPLAAIHKREYPDFIMATRELLAFTNKPYSIENVPQAPLINPLILCGTMFGLRVIRHRAFECNPPIYFPPAQCNHWGRVSGNAAREDRRRVPVSFENFDILTITGHDFRVKDAQIAMGIDWLGQKGLAQAVPPAYTEFIGHHLMGEVRKEAEK